MYFFAIQEGVCFKQRNRFLFRKAINFRLDRRAGYSILLFMLEIGWRSKERFGFRVD
jgi:hypothetical protein